MTVALLLVLLTASAYAAGETARLVRFKISAGDLTSAIAVADDYKTANGVDPEYLDAIGWIARGAEMLRRPDIARRYVEELHREIPQEAEATLIPYGAAIEVEGRLIAASEGRGAGIRYFEQAFANAKATSLRSRIRKNINMLSLEGETAPAIASVNFDKPTLLFFWAAGCGDCKGQSASLQRAWTKYRSRGLQVVAITRVYDETDIHKWWAETFPAMQDVPIIVDTDAMVRYGVSATPTFVIVDSRGVVRLYTPTRLAESELFRRIDDVLR